MKNILLILLCVGSYATLFYCVVVQSGWFIASLSALGGYVLSVLTFSVVSYNRPNSTAAAILAILLWPLEWLT